MMKKVLLIIACIGLAKAPTIKFQDRTELAYCETAAEADVGLSKEHIGLGLDTEHIDEGDERAGQLRTALSVALGAPVIESVDGFDLSKVDNDNYLCTVDLEGEMSLKLLMNWNCSEKGSDFELALESYGFCTAMSLTSEKNHPHLSAVMSGIILVFRRYGIDENKISKIADFIEASAKSTRVRADVGLGKFPVQTYIKICKDFIKLGAGFVPGSI